VHKNHKHLLVAVGTAVASCAMAVCGLTAASAANSAGTRPVVSGSEKFYAMTTSPTSSRYSAIATGVFTAGGFDDSGRTADTLHFPGGTFRVNHGATHGTQVLNPRTCLFTARQKGAYTISGGTGRYAGISGSGTAVISILGVGARNSKGQCSQNLTPVAWQQVISGKGHVKL
jgi:hypothetical protein